MGNFKAIFVLLFLSAFSAHAEALKKTKPHEELMVVQTVSKDRHSFVVSKGIKDGVFKGQEIIYANDNVSILCKAIETSRDFSLWVPLDKNANVPFNKDEIISYNSHAYGNVALEVVGDIKEITPMPEDFKIPEKSVLKSNNFALKGSFGKGLSQSSSNVSADKDSTRAGYTFSLEYNYRLMPEFEMSFGARFDSEVNRISSPQLDIPTSRTMATAAATYHLLNFSKDKNYFYLSLAVGLGNSKTTVNEEIASGYAILLPEVRLGYLMPLSKSTSFVVEASVESISSHEKFSDSTTQVTNTLNSKFSLGLRF